MRGADGGPWNRICALPALWVGLLYDQSALDAAWDLVKGWSIEEQQSLRDAVPSEGLDARAPGGGTVGALAHQVLDIAAAGLKARGEVNSMGDNEVRSEEHTSELQSLMRISYAVFCLKTKKKIHKDER